MYTFVGLGNPGNEYEFTRHNAGRMALEAFARKEGLSEWEAEKKTQSLKTEGEAGKEAIVCLLPETFMNKSGNAVKNLPGQKIKTLVVLHDDIDIPLGKFKISFGRGSGGHKGVESIMRTLKTKDFIRVRIGISPKKKPDMKENLDFLLKKFKPAEMELLKKTLKKINEAILAIVTDGLAKAMSRHN